MSWKPSYLRGCHGTCFRAAQKRRLEYVCLPAGRGDHKGSVIRTGLYTIRQLAYAQLDDCVGNLV